MKKKTKYARPKHLNLLKIHLPITGIASISHRLSGIILFLAIPASLYLLQLSVTSADGFKQTIDYLSLPWLKLVLIPLIWAFAHHLFAGLRFLLIDQNIAVGLAAARKSAWLVVIAAGVVTIIVVGRWLL